MIHIIWSCIAADIFDQSQCILIKLKGVLFCMLLFFRRKHLIQGLQWHELRATIYCVHYYYVR